MAPRHDVPTTQRCGLIVPSLDAGGLEEVVAMLATELPAHGFETSVLCTHRGGAIADRLQGAGVSVTVAKGSARQWRAWIKRTQPTVFSTHFVSLPAAALLAKWAPIVETVHNTYLWLSPKEWEAQRATTALASAVVAVSETVASYHQRTCGPLPATVIPNGVQGSRLPDIARSDARERLNLGPDDMAFVHVGRFCAQKNQLGLVDALAEVVGEDARVHLLLVGGQDDAGYVDQVRARAGGLLTRGAVRFIAPTPDPAFVFAASDAFVSNSFFEGWSLAATEALWMGRPVILSHCGGAREQTGEDGRLGYLVPNPGGDPATLALQQVQHPSAEVTTVNRNAMQLAVRTLIANRAHWASRSDEIAREARARWSSERMAAEYAAVLRAAAGA